MKNYIDLINDILNNGVVRHPNDERTGVGTRSVFGRMLRFDLREGFPLVTTRHVSMKLVAEELFWFLNGNPSVKLLHNVNCHIWDDWAVTEESRKAFKDMILEITAVDNAMFEEATAPTVGTIGEMYGSMWRAWPRSKDQITYYDLHHRERVGIASDHKKIYTDVYNSIIENSTEEEKTKAMSLDDYIKRMSLSHIDQIQDLLYSLKTDPYSRRHVVTAMNPELYPIPGLPPNVQPMIMKGSLYPCHYAFQCYVSDIEGKKHLSMLVNIRSWDVPLGGPFNIASYALLLTMIAREVDMVPYEVIMSIGDAHIYLNQHELVNDQINNEPYPLPTLTIKGDKSIYDLSWEDIELSNYQHHGKYDYERNV